MENISQSNNKSRESPLVKVNIITGFLGSGKTTFIQKALGLALFGVEKIVLIENEFGKIGMDGIALAHEELKIFEISRGCICCTLKGEFTRTIHQIVEDLKPDRILIEPSGIFVMEDVAEIFKDSRIASKCVLSGIHTIVDIAFYKETKMRYARFFESQIQAATHLIVSKIENHTEEEIDWTINLLHQENKEAKIIALPYELMTKEDLQCILVSQKDRQLQELDGVISNQEVPVRMHFTKQGVSHQELYPLESLAFGQLNDWTNAQLEDFVDKIRQETFGSIIRMKGFLLLDDKCMNFQYTYGTVTLSEMPPEEEIPSGLVIIGENLNKSALRSLFVNKKQKVVSHLELGGNNAIRSLRKDREYQ